MRIIVLEGVDGTGKTTQINNLMQRIIDKKVLFIREPGGIPGDTISQKIRDIILEGIDDPITEYLLFSACRRRNILNITDEYDYIIFDRFFPSSLIYQGRYIREDCLNFIFDFIKQDKSLEYMTIILDCPLSVIIERMNNRHKDALDMINIENIVYYQNKYRSLVDCKSTFLVDVNRDSEDVTNDILKLIQGKNW